MMQRPWSAAGQTPITCQQKNKQEKIQSSGFDPSSRRWNVLSHFISSFCHYLVWGFCFTWFTLSPAPVVPLYFLLGASGLSCNLMCDGENTLHSLKLMRDCKIVLCLIGVCLRDYILLALTFKIVCWLGSLAKKVRCPASDLLELECLVEQLTL